MNVAKVDELLRYCAKISTFLINVKHRICDDVKKAEISETVENYLDGFCFPSAPTRKWN